MFNELFFFFWAVHLVGSLVKFLAIASVVVLCVGGLFVMAKLDEDDGVNKAKKSAVSWGAVVGLLLACALVVPPKEAFYAGAAQYVGEATEIDDTLIELKKLVDQKIGELSTTESDE